MHACSCICLHTTAPGDVTITTTNSGNTTSTSTLINGAIYRGNLTAFEKFTRFINLEVLKRPVEPLEGLPICAECTLLVDAENERSVIILLSYYPYNCMNYTIVYKANTLNVHACTVRSIIVHDVCKHTT
jgi:hypothetical protein